jgi:hypothetical protein
MSFFLKSGKTFHVTTKAALDIHERLPVGTYTVGFSESSGQYFLETIDSFEVNGKLYGDTNRNAERILRVFDDREVSTGVLLTGEKGAGKTMLAKRISVLAAAQDIPTIVVNQAWCGEKFNSFVQMIEQPALVIFDEFEKVYSGAGKQESLLTLLDGVYPSKKLFLLTCNDKWKLNTNMHNRPGRIYYMLDYHGLDQDFIREYCQDNLLAKEQIPMVCSITQIFSAFNFDMLKALVEEMNRFGETPAEALKFLNARPNFNVSTTYKVQLIVDGKEIDVSQGSPKWTGNPLKNVVRIFYDHHNTTALFTAQDLKNVDPHTGAYVFVNQKKNHKLVLKPMKSSFDVNFETLQLMYTPETPLTESESDEEPLVEADGDY